MQSPLMDTQNTQSSLLDTQNKPSSQDIQADRDTQWVFLFKNKIAFSKGMRSWTVSGHHRVLDPALLYCRCCLVLRALTRPHASPIHVFCWR